MGKKCTTRLIILTMAVLATFLIGSIACSNDRQGSDTNGDTANGNTQQDTPILTVVEVRGLVYQYLDLRLYETAYRNRLTAWGGRTGGVYVGDHVWNVSILGLGIWAVHERTQVVTPSDMMAQSIARSHFR